MIKTDVSVSDSCKFIRISLPLFWFINQILNVGEAVCLTMAYFDVSAWREELLQDNLGIYTSHSSDFNERMNASIPYT